MRHANQPTFSPDFGPIPAAEPVTAAPDLIRGVRKVRGKKRTLLAKTDDAALAAAIIALVAASDIEQPLAQAHTAAEVALQVVEKDPGATDVQKEKARKAERKAEAAFQRAQGKLDKAADAVLAVPVMNATDALLQQRAFAWAHDAADATEVPFEEDLGKALASALAALRSMTAAPTPEPSDQPRPSQQLVAAWHDARAAYEAAVEAHRALVPSTNAEEYEKAYEASLDAVAEAMETWETLPPPGLDELVEVMIASLDFNGFDYRWNNSRDHRSWRDLLDGGDTHEIFAARFTLHAMRLCHSKLFDGHPALSVVPSSGLYQPFDSIRRAGDEPDAAHRAWTDHHEAILRGRFPPCRPAQENIDRWWRVILNDPMESGRQSVAGRDNLNAWFDSRRELIAAE